MLLTFSNVLIANEIATPNNSQKLSDSDKKKAQYLFHVTRFITWNDKEFNRNNQAINLCIDTISDSENASDDAFKTYLNTILKKHDASTGKKPIHLLNLNTNANTEVVCHINYIRSSNNTALANTQHGLKIAASSAQATSSTAIIFFEQEGKVQFDIYPTRANEQGVTFSSELLKIAHVHLVP